MKVITFKHLDFIQTNKTKLLILVYAFEKFYPLLCFNSHVDRKSLQPPPTSSPSLYPYTLHPHILHPYTSPSFYFTYTLPSHLHNPNTLLDFIVKNYIKENFKTTKIISIKRLYKFYMHDLMIGK